MQFLFLTLLASAVAVTPPHGSALINDPKHIEALNKINSTWTAGVNRFFDNLSYNDVRSRLGTELLHISDFSHMLREESVYTVIADASVPTDFDARTKWGNLIHPIRNQEQCGSCWAFSAAEVFSDRVSIALNKATPPLSPEDMVSCDSNDNGCGGGRLPTAWDYLTNTGIVSDTCFPYTAGSGDAPSCPTKCVDGESWASSKVKAQSGYAINGVANMQKEIMTHGPIQVAYVVYKSFMSYTGGVYQKHWYEVLPEGGHAVKILGWGVESSTDYWLVANSWGPEWGLQGYFKIKRGSNACGIEQMGPPYAGLPVVSSEQVVV
jgi:cathepsin B